MFGKKVMVLLMVLVISIAVMPTSVFAASGPYKDVNKKTLDKESVKSIKYLKKHGAYKGVIKGKKFRPMKKFTRRQYLRILKNLYPGKVTVTKADKKKYNKKVTEYYVCHKMVQVAANYGMKIKWNGSKKKKLSRASVSNYIRSFSEFDPAFKLKS